MKFITLPQPGGLWKLTLIYFWEVMIKGENSADVIL